MVWKEGSGRESSSWDFDFMVVSVSVSVSPCRRVLTNPSPLSQKKSPRRGGFETRGFETPAHGVSETTFETVLRQRI